MATVFYPWGTLVEPVDLRVTALRIDGGEPGLDVLEHEARLVVLDRLQRDWSSLELDVSLRAATEEILRFDEKGVAPAAVAMAFSTKTNERQAVALTRSGPDPGRWLGTVELDRRQFRGKMRLRGLIAGSVDGVTGRFLGESPAWAVYFDEPDVPPIEGMLRVRWTDFKGPNRNESIPPTAENESFFVAVQDQPPAVYLNRGFEGLGGLLSDNDNRPDGERALRDAEYRRIAAAAWTEMLGAALADVETEDDESDPSWPPDDWKRDALEALLPRLYPDVSDSTERLALAVKESTGDGAARFHALAQVGINLEIKAARGLADDIKRVSG